MNRSIHAVLSNAAYGSPEFNPDGTSVEIDAGYGQKYKAVLHMDKPSGYQGTIFQNIATRDYVIAHRGTEIDRELLKDGVVDMVMVTGRFNAQLKDALELTRIAKGMAERDGKQLSVTGHSLGGGLGQVCAHHYNLPGDAFNPYGVVSLGYRIEEGQPAHAAPFTNHVMAGDFVSAGSKHYGSVQTYALPSELKTLREAEIGTRMLGAATGMSAQMAATPLLVGALADSHRMKHFVDREENGVLKRSVLDDPSARVRDPEDQRRVDAFRADVHALRSGVSLLSRGGPGLLLDGLNHVRGPDQAGGYAQRMAQAAELAAHPFIPSEQRNAAAAQNGSPRRDQPEFNTRSPLQQRLDELLAADPERFLQLNRELAHQGAGQRLDTQVRAQLDAEEREREQAQELARQQAAQQEQQQAAPAMRR